jgi:hypothetical protein
MEKGPTTMKPREPLQPIIDPFITSCGGELVTDLLERNADPRPQNADYLFRDAGVIAELKALEDDSFGEPFRKKMGDLTGSWHRRGLLRVFGTRRIELDQLPLPCQEEALSLIGKPLENNVLKKANQQLRATKELLKMPEAKGLLMVVGDGNEDLPPSDVLFFLARLLQKKHPDGTPQFSSVHSLVYFNPRMPALLPSTGRPALIWANMLRQAEDHEMVAFLNTLGDSFRGYMERTMGVPFPEVGLEATQHRNLKFAGVSPRMPRVDVNDSPPRRKPRDRDAPPQPAGWRICSNSDPSHASWSQSLVAERGRQQACEKGPGDSKASRPG